MYIIFSLKTTLLIGKLKQKLCVIAKLIRLIKYFELSEWMILLNSCHKGKGLGGESINFSEGKILPLLLLLIY